MYVNGIIYLHTAKKKTSSLYSYSAVHFVEMYESSFTLFRLYVYRTKNTQNSRSNLFVVGYSVNVFWTAKCEIDRIESEPH